MDVCCRLSGELSVDDRAQQSRDGVCADPRGAGLNSPTMSMMRWKARIPVSRIRAGTRPVVGDGRYSFAFWIVRMDGPENYARHTLRFACFRV